MFCEVHYTHNVLRSSRKGTELCGSVLSRGWEWSQGKAYVRLSVEWKLEPRAYLRVVAAVRVGQEKEASLSHEDLSLKTGV